VLSLIGGTTRLVALVGHPVAHSLSPRMQNAAFAARALDWAYVALDVPPEQLEEAVRGLVAGGFAGANVTIPHKRAAALLCDEADGEAVNTLVFTDGRIHGFNTDREIVASIDSKRVCLIGAARGGGDAAAGPARRGAAVLPARRVASRRRRLRPRRQRDAGCATSCSCSRTPARRSSSSPTARARPRS